MWLGAKVSDKLRTQNKNCAHCPQEHKWHKASFKKPEYSSPTGKPVLPCFAAYFSLGQRCEKGVGWCSLLPCIHWQFPMAEFHHEHSLRDTETIRECWELFRTRNAWEAANCACMCPFQQELSISASRRPFPFCLWFGSSCKDVISAECFLKASTCAVGWRYCPIYSRPTLTLPHFYTDLLHFAVRDAKPCCTNLKLLN